MSGGGQVVPFDRGRLRDDVRQALADPWRTCELLGLLEGAKREATGVIIRCPAHSENNGSCSVTRGPDGTLRARCFACDFSGDVFNLIAAVRGLDVRRDFPRVLADAAELAGISIPATGQPRASARPAMPGTQAPAVAQAQADDLGPLWEALPPIDAEAFDYLRARGLEVAADWCRGLADVADPRPAAPAGHERDAEGQRSCGGAVRCAACRWEYAGSGYGIALALRDVRGRIVAIQVRNTRAEKGEGRDNRFLAIGPTGTGLFGDPTSVAAARNVIIAEGMTDWLAVASACNGARVTVALGIAGVNAGAALDTLALKGKRVLLAADPDDAGDLLCDGRTDAQAEEESRLRGRAVRPVLGLIAKLRATGAYPLRARPPEGSDLAAMLLAGVDLVAFFRRALSEVAGFKTAASRLEGERERRLAVGPRLLTFGTRFLDLALGGIAPTDIVLLGGVSGIGKTEAARMVAQANAARGRRVHYFALEDDAPEIEQRAKFVVLADIVLGRVGGSRYYDRWNYLDWSYGRLDDVTGQFEDEADRRVADLHRNLFTRYPGDGFTVDAFASAYEQLGEDTDLVVVDHFHYLDFGENENRSAKLAMRTMRELVKRHRRPILLVAHIRKATGRAAARLIPVLDDFHGSSDVVKQATKAVLIAPASDRANTASHLWKTYLSAGKCRVEGSRARYAACVTFDARRRSYDDAFLLGSVSPAGDKFTELDPRRWPSWALRGRQEPLQEPTPSEPGPPRDPGSDDD